MGLSLMHPGDVFHTERLLTRAQGDSTGCYDLKDPHTRPASGPVAGPRAQPLLCSVQSAWHTCDVCTAQPKADTGLGRLGSVLDIKRHLK